MTDIPEDIMEVAHEATKGVKCFPPSDFASLNISVARAIMEERHRCAGVARAYGTNAGLPDGKTSAFRKHRHAIAEAILKT